ncbi:DNA helicase [Alicyclobacillus contaminans]|uniref:HelD family protein n=1 Tax=Alicyclobacillus contaminans TaxID=392016 RepID=UPI00041335DC|nr:UvrD-helicase domain-containing protein [Alicyclobacillus contaminans]GMA49786.1 DNA helicase [Alicyclobacillus contaminans]
MDAKEWNFEQAYLEQVQDTLDAAKARATQASSKRFQDLLEHRRYMWENVGHDAASEEIRILQAQHVADLADQSRDYETFDRLVEHYNQIQRRPYFARMDLRFQDTPSPETFYLGIATIRRPNNMKILVHDWRAPIASVYYDATPGPFSVNTPLGEETGQMILKRQYRIQGRTLEGMFDTDVHIGDDMLQSLLAKHADERMTSIVTSIQREQNQAIRNIDHRVFVVQGPAGSGKTSVALQRIAYLLYVRRQSLASQQVLFFTPNAIFQDYISNVLPELGEDNVQTATFMDYVRRAYALDIPMESFYAHLDAVLDGVSAIKAESIRLKFSRVFYELMQRYVEHLSRRGISFAPLRLRGKVVLRAETLAEWFYGPLARYRMPARFQHLADRLDGALRKWSDALQQRLTEKWMARTDYIGTDDEIQDMSRRQAKREADKLRADFERQVRELPLRLYRQLFERDETFAAVSQGLGLPAEMAEIRRHTVAALADGGPIPYEDAMPILYLYTAMLPPVHREDIRHVLVDEAQDYTRLQYDALRRLFPRAGFTVLGDLHQSVHPLMPANEFHHLDELFGPGETAVCRLHKSYRSTAEILRFAADVLGEPDVADSIRRGGDAPQVLSVPVTERIRAVADAVEALQPSSASIAVICRTASDTESMHRALSSRWSVHLITANADTFQSGVVVVPSYLAKGLEFDAVIVSDADAYAPEERRLLYTACTRALHQLVVIRAAGR